MHTKALRTRLSRYGFIFLLLLGLSACTTKMAYNFLDWAIEWKVQRLVKLHGEQKLMTKRAIKDFHQWHRATQLPQYAEYLQQLQKRLNAGPWTGEEIHAETDKIQLLVDLSVERALPDAAEVLATLSDAQVKELLASVAEERDEYKEDYVDISERKRQKKYYKEFLKHAQDWLGPLSSAQKKQIEKWSESLQPFETLNLQQQKIWEDTLAEILVKRADKNALLEELKGLMFHRTDNWQPELEQILDYNQKISYELVAELLNGMSEQQRKHLNKKISEYVKLLGELTTEAKKPR